MILLRASFNAAVATATIVVALCGSIATTFAAAPVDLALREEAAFRAAAAAAAPCVVSIETVGGLDMIGEQMVGTGPSSGVIVSADGYIASSMYNFAHKPASIIVVAADGSRYPARLVGRDEARKLVLLKVDADKPLPVAQPTPESEMVVGQWCVAIGRTFDASQPNISVGIVSAVNRIWGRALQTDAKVSPANYGGALVDLRGRVLGVLVPLSPDHRDDVSGLEWYDSGIGFAVTLEHVQKILPRLQAGETLKQGVVGVHFKGTNVYADPPLVAKSRAGSPAYDAGIRAGDRFTAVEGRPVDYQSQVMEQLHRRYAGDVIKVTIARGDETFERELKLVEKLEPYRRPFFGLLVERTAKPADGAKIRFVFEGSPAAEAGLKAGDVVTSFQSQPVRDRDELRTAAAEADIGKTATFEYRRGDMRQTVELTAAEESEAIPPADANSVATDKSLPVAKPVKIKVAEFANEAELFVPAGYDEVLPHGLVILLHPQGGFADRAIVERWRDRCREAKLLLLVPSAVEGKWTPRDLAYLKKVIDRAAESYHVDAARVSAVGYEEGGAVALRAAASLRERIRGIALVNAAPTGFNAENEPGLPTSFFIATARGFSGQARLTPAVERLRELRFPTVVRQLPRSADDFDDGVSSELLRWLDALDRI